MKRRSAPRRAARGVAAIAIVATAPGCAGTTESEDAVPTQFAATIEWAQQDGASEEQIALMTDGELTFEEVSSAVDRSLTCMQDLGFHVIDEGIDDSAGYPKRMYTYSGSPAGFADGGGDEGQECLEEHSFFVESAWYDAPQSVAGRQQKLDSVKPQVIACLADIGIEVPDTATYDELLDLNVEAFVHSGTDCVVEAGIPSY